ncbi:ribbon-helix-helix domain-containing protein [Methanomethylovorans hollandica]|nr:ribbon-helix-helix domain-containing protein [Methanomethylovorans hollandica]
MKRFTVSLPDELKKEMDVFPDVNYHSAKDRVASCFIP